jgi:hypothetical protein
MTDLYNHAASAASRGWTKIFYFGCLVGVLVLLNLIRTGYSEMNTIPKFPDSISEGYAIIDTTSTSSVQLITGGSNGVSVSEISCVTDTSTDIDFDLLYTIGGTTIKRGRFTVPDGAGDNGTDAAEKVNKSTNFPWLPDDETLLVPPGTTVSVQPRAALPSGKSVWFYAIGGAY